MNKYKKYMIISLTILVISIVGSTFALYTKTLSNDVGINTNTPGLDKYIIYEKGNDITGTLNVSATYLGGTSSNIKFYKKDNTYNIYGKIELTVNEIGTNLSNSKALKYALVNNGNVLSEGSLNGTSNGSKINIINNLYLEDTEQIYTIYVWLDINEELGNISGENLDISVDCSADMLGETLASHITNLYINSEKEVITNNSIEYNYATSVSLMNDRLGGTTTDYNGGNIRYYGASPNNYVYFNCDDYSNQTSDTCELWRIIGVFDGKVKIMRNESIGAYSWDNKNTSTGAEDEKGSNNWTTARLMKLLNPSDYYTIDTNDNGYGQSLYYNKESGKCFSEQNNAIVDCDFTSTGIKNNITRNMISKERWYLGASSVVSNYMIYADTTYLSERSTNAYSGNSTEWEGKIALPYTSDYIYAFDFSICTTNVYKYSGEYNEEDCKPNNWQVNDETRYSSNTADKGVFLLNASNSSSIAVHGFRYDGAVTGYYAQAYLSIFPTLYLSSSIINFKGIGTVDNPYQLS